MAPMEINDMHTMHVGSKIVYLSIAKVNCIIIILHACMRSRG